MNPLLETTLISIYTVSRKKSLEIIYCCFQQWKNFQNQLMKLLQKVSHHFFLRHSVHVGAVFVLGAVLFRNKWRLRKCKHVSRKAVEFGFQHGVGTLPCFVSIWIIIVLQEQAIPVIKVCKNDPYFSVFHTVGKYLNSSVNSSYTCRCFMASFPILRANVFFFNKNYRI